MNVIRVKVFPKSKKVSIIELAPKQLTVHVREDAENNMANKAVISAVAHYYKIPQNKLRIILGHQKPTKLLEILP